eukprot:6212256-Pleurochrysis_carterae.AAC.1
MSQHRLHEPRFAAFTACLRYAVLHAVRPWQEALLLLCELGTDQVRSMSNVHAGVPSRVEAVVSMAVSIYVRARSARLAGVCPAQRLCIKAFFQLFLGQSLTVKRGTQRA